MTQGKRKFSHSILENLGDVAVDTILWAADFLAAPLARLDSLLRPARNATVRARLRAIASGLVDDNSGMRAIWFSRAVREGFNILSMAGLERAVLRRVTLVGDHSALSRSCIFAIIHSPWDRVLARWLASQQGAVVFATGRWDERARGAHLPCNWRGIRKLVQHLRSGGVAAVTVDHFAGRASMFSTHASVLGRDVQVSTGAARLAVVAGVPLVPVTTRFRCDRLEIVIGDEIEVAAKTISSATRAVLATFDREVCRDPSIWANAHPFLGTVAA